MNDQMTNPTAEEVELLRLRVESYLSRTDTTWGDFAKLVGRKSPSIITQVLRGTYTSPSGPIYHKISATMDMVESQSINLERRKLNETSYTKRGARLIDTAIAQSYAGGRIVLIIGQAGSGKSVIFRLFTAQNPNAILLVLDATMHAASIIKAIGRTLGQRYDVSLQKSASIVAETLRYRQVVVMLDEASHLNVKAIDILRSVVCVAGGRPLILAGNNDLLRTISQAPDNGKASLDQFTSRMLGVFNLSEHEYMAQDIRCIFEYENIALTADAVALLRQIAMMPGSGRLRTCETLVEALHSVESVRQAGTITGELVRQAAAELALPLNLGLAIPNDTYPGATVAAVAS